MGKDPAVLFYTSDFLTGTSRFTDEQEGQYIRALCNQHQGGHFTLKELLAFIKTEDSPVMKKFIKDQSGLYFNERMDLEKEKRSKYSASRSKNIGSRWGKNNKSLSGKKIDDIHMNNICNTHVIHMENENDNRIGIDCIKEKPLWKTSFPEYEKQIGEAYDGLIANAEWLQERKKYHPNLDIRLSMEKAFNDFWGQEAGWIHKKKSKTDVINWDTTFKNALTLKGNQVYEKRI
jgi:uncharacterized protein YdaU (DUF1376 family)